MISTSSLLFLWSVYTPVNKHSNETHTASSKYIHHSWADGQGTSSDASKNAVNSQFINIWFRARSETWFLNLGHSIFWGAVTGSNNEWKLCNLHLVFYKCKTLPFKNGVWRWTHFMQVPRRFFGYSALPVLMVNNSPANSLIKWTNWSPDFWVHRWIDKYNDVMIHRPLNHPQKNGNIWLVQKKKNHMSRVPLFWGLPHHLEPHHKNKRQALAITHGTSWPWFRRCPQKFPPNPPMLFSTPWKQTTFCFKGLEAWKWVGELRPPSPHRVWGIKSRFSDFVPKSSLGFRFKPFVLQVALGKLGDVLL